MKKILFITHYDNLYGANRALLTLVKKLKSEGRYEPMVVIPQNVSLPMSLMR